MVYSLIHLARCVTHITLSFVSVHEEYLFLQHLELDPVLPNKDQESKKSGRTPFTTTHKLTRPTGGSYGFSIAWTHPPRYTHNHISQVPISTPIPYLCFPYIILEPYLINAGWKESNQIYQQMQLAYNPVIM